MPVTVKLSRRFYDTFGDEIANEFVGWFNLVDATYRSEIGELFGTNFARFDAKLEQRVAELRAELRAEFERRISALDAKLEQRTAEVRAEIREGLATLEGRMLARLGVMEGRFAIAEGRQLRWMFLFWIGTLGTVIALLRL